jgi:ABC-2 type transport system permease protein
MWLSTVVNYIKLMWLFKKMSLRNAISYPTSFFVQVLGMVLNDGAWLLMWALFFKRFPTVNGWDFNYLLLLYAFGTLLFAICIVPAEGIMYLAQYIVSGELDAYLTLPKHVLWSVAVSKVDISAIGDGLFGLILLFFVYGFAVTKICWFLILAIFAALLFFDFILIVQSLAFWLGDVDEVAKRLVHMLISLMMYPLSIFSGFLKLITMVLLPTFFMVGVPLSLMINFTWWYFVIFLLAVTIGTIGAFWFFNKGLARYESGNLMTTRQ